MGELHTSLPWDIPSYCLYPRHIRSNTWCASRNLRVPCGHLVAIFLKARVCPWRGLPWTLAHVFISLITHPPEAREKVLRTATLGVVVYVWGKGRSSFDGNGRGNEKSVHSTTEKG